MEKINLICIECPRGCPVVVEKEGDKIISVTGFTCLRGKNYAIAEVTQPKRVLTSTVRTVDGMIPVKTDVSINKDDIFKLMKIIRSVYIEHDVQIGDVLIENIDGNGANLIATASHLIKK